MSIYKESAAGMTGVGDASAANQSTMIGQLGFISDPVTNRYLSSTSTGSIPVGVKEFSITNVGVQQGTITTVTDGVQPLPKGFSLSQRGKTTNIISWDATNTQFIIEYIL